MRQVHLQGQGWQAQRQGQVWRWRRWPSRTGWVCGHVGPGQGHWGPLDQETAGRVYGRVGTEQGQGGAKG